jgi:hypothetical protein
MVSSVLCIVCMTREPAAFAGDELLICVECSASYEHCAACGEPYDFGLSGLDGACEACLDAAERRRLRHAA